MFAGSPQPVEIHHHGIWYSGELIGWRHEGNGRVAARVRCVVDGLRHSTWKDLTDLRLPDPGNPPRRERFPAGVRRAASIAADGEDETRPHALLAGSRGRPVKPAHAVSPPAPMPAARSEGPAYGSREPSPGRRRNDGPHWRTAHLSAV
jgi:hypothetical protein